MAHTPAASGQAPRAAATGSARLDSPGGPAGPGLRVCTVCVMDESDPEIRFDAQGRCQHCRQAEALLRRPPLGLSPAERAAGLARLVERIRADGSGRDFDCVIGLSGGVDSSFLALETRRLGLRPLAVHVDNGWDTRLAVSNIERIVSGLSIELETVVLEWEEFRDLQRAFIEAWTPDLEIPTDHAIVASLWHTAAREGIRWILLGTNLRTESILPRAWSHGHDDWGYIAGIQRRFGRVPLRTFPHLTLAQRLLYKRVRRIRAVSLLDWCEYVKRDAVADLERELGWEPYQGKHHESVYTRFYQAWLLPTRFGFDKRRAHLSSLIASGQCTRQEALRQLEEPACAPEQAAEDLAYVASKLELSPGALEALFARPPRRFQDYPSYERSRLYRLGRRVLHRLWPA